MERWEGRVALVTGASSGIGAAICQDLVQHGMKVIGVARRVDRIEELAESLQDEKGALHPMKCDIANEDEIQELFDAIKDQFEGVDVCINNAGMAVENSLIDGEPKEWHQMMNINMISATHFSKLAIESMKERDINDGHIIYMNSIAGHTIIPVKEYHFYSATKHALRVQAESLRMELRELKSGIKVSSVSPGLVRTEFFENSPKAIDMFSDFPHLQSKDLADIVTFVLSTPPSVEVNDILVTPLG